MQARGNEDFIRDKVESFARQNNIRILSISEGGSHAWGYATETSDYDVKFVYHQYSQDYLSMWERADNYQFKSEPLHEFQGWDLKKFLHLLWKSNAQTYEFVHSPVKYCRNQELEAFTLEELNSSKYGVFMHYYGLAHRTFKERIMNVGEPTLKKYLYVLRPLLSIEQMFAKELLPTLDFQELLTDAIVFQYAPQDVLSSMADVLSHKREGNLTKLNQERLGHVDKWVQERLTFWSANHKIAHEKLKGLEKDKEKYDNLFKKLASLQNS